MYQDSFVKKKIHNNKYLYVTPGVILSSKGDRIDQQYNSPDKIPLENNSDLIIVGRDIYMSSEPNIISKKYSDISWNSYLKNIAK